MSTPTEEQIAAQFHFAQLAGQYYVSGRFSAFSNCFPVAGNLLHHAVEMFLKCALSRHLTLEELKKMSHGLPNLWNKFKEIHNVQNLSSLDDSISELDKFEIIRYPNSVVKQGMQISFVHFRYQFSRLPEGPQPPYHLVLEDIDLICSSVANYTGLHSKSFFSSIWTPEVKHYLEMHNIHRFKEFA